MSRRLPNAIATLFACVSLSVVVAAAGCKEEEPRPAVGDPGGGPVSPGGGSSSSSSSSGGSSSGDGGIVADSGDAGEAGAACTALTINGGIVDQVAVNGDIPAGTGGEILVGNYDLTDARIYTGAAGIPGLTGNGFQGSMIISDGLRIERAVVVQTSNNVRTESRVVGTIIPNGVNAVVSLTCPFTTQEQVTYTVNSSTLIMTNLVTKESFSFTRKL